MTKIEINERFELALKYLQETDKNLFITGKAGTGKSTLLEYFRTNTNKRVAVLAPTGVSALNVRGQTIHSFFRFGPHTTVHNVLDKKLPKKQCELIAHLDAIVIDEASMLRADLLDCIDTALKYYRKEQGPFGGLQMIFFGDLYQLPPVVAGPEEREMFSSYYQSPYFFDAQAFQNFDFEIIGLKKIYRQEDQNFIDLLNKVRNNTVSQFELNELNQRCNPHYEPIGEFCITLTTTNAAADKINKAKLKELNSDSKKFTADVRGDFTQKHFPTTDKLELKVGSQVMLLNNESTGRWVNGTVGKIVKIRFDAFETDDVLEVELPNGDVVDVGRHKWEVFKYFFNEDEARLDTESIGSFEQYPIRLAWAVTIHKSQGKTFDNVIIDIGTGAFAHGQVYVALSRCTSLEGIVLKKPILKHHIKLDHRIQNFVRSYVANRNQQDYSENSFQNSPENEFEEPQKFQLF